MGKDVGFRLRIRALEAGITYLSYPLCLCVCVCACSLPAALSVLFALPLRGPYVGADRGGVWIPLCYSIYYIFMFLAALLLFFPFLPYLICLLH